MIDTVILAGSNCVSMAHPAGDSCRRAASMCLMLDAACMGVAPWPAGYILLAAKGRARNCTTCTKGVISPVREGCPEVLDLPQMSVAAYIEAQAAKRFEVAQDEYLELMQKLADSAFAFLLESGLAESGDRQTLRLWREMGREKPQQLQGRLGPEWIDLLMLPDLTDGLHDPVAFSRRHHDLLLLKAQESFGTLDNVTDFCKASELLMGLALHLGRGLGANPAELAEHWIKTAKEHGALD